MKRFKVTFATQTGRQKSRRFRAPNLLEAQAQFHGVKRAEVTHCKWEECVEIQDKEITDELYDEYTAKHPNRDVTFISFVGNKLSKE